MQPLADVQPQVVGVVGDVHEVREGGYLLYDSTWPLDAGLHRDDITFLGVPWRAPNPAGRSAINYEGSLLTPTYFRSNSTSFGGFLPELEVAIGGILAPRRFLDLVRDFLVFEDDGSGRLVKKMAGYHQFHAVRVAVEETLRAAAAADWQGAEPDPGRFEAGRRHGGDPGDRRVGVVWHTQGSGKSLTMAFYAGRIIREPAMENPTLVVLTDRNDLDDQLFGTFSRCQDLLRQPPVQAESRTDLRAKLAVDTGGVVFTTIQKFLPEEKGDRYPVLSERRNIIVIADEAHRSQYDFIDGFARHMRDALPHASFIGFTGTPIELQDASTRAVFGDYISVYDIQRAVQDGATVPIYYESRLAKLALDEAGRPKIDPDFEEATEGETVTPMLLASRFTVNPVLVILGVIFWYWVWGVCGAVLATPLLAITKIVCDRIEPLRPVGHFIGG